MFNEKDFYLFASTIFFYGFIALTCVVVVPEVVTMGTLGNLGAFVGGLATLVGVPFLILNLINQRKALLVQEDSLRRVVANDVQNELEKEFRFMCESIDFGIESLTLGVNKGVEALKRASDVRVDSISDEEIERLERIVVSFSSLYSWIEESSFLRCKFLHIILTRYKNIINLLYKFIPSDGVGWTIEKYQSVYEYRMRLYLFYNALAKLIKIEKEACITCSARVEVENPYSSNFTRFFGEFEDR